MKISDLDQVTWRLNHIKKIDDLIKHIVEIENRNGQPFAMRDFGYWTEAAGVLPTPPVAKQIRDLLKVDLAEQRAALVSELAGLGVSIDVAA